MWRPGDEAPADDDVASLLHSKHHKNLPISKQRQLLPIYYHRESLLYALETHRTVIIVGETGSGKTTQLPQYLHEAGWTQGGRQVVCTQPRRIAALSVAQRVADEMGRDLGGIVGYAVRFDNRTCPDTCIKFCTDGLLIREALSDPLLSRISCVMVDEAHERSLHTDVLLGLLKKVQKRRPDLRIIISSATMDAQLFKDFFEVYNPLKRRKKKSKFSSPENQHPQKPYPSSSSSSSSLSSSSSSSSSSVKDDPTRDTAIICSISGRCHPVTMHYLDKPCFDYVKCAAETVLSVHRKFPLMSNQQQRNRDGRREDSGDILVFLPGMEEVDQCCRMIRELEEVDNVAGLWILPLYSNLPQFEQMKVFEKPRRGVRKVIVSTTISETSVTIDGVVHVIDAGFQRLPYFDPETGVEALMTSAVSQASARQRAGRAGRTQPGQCFRLFTLDAYNQLSKTTPCEMQRTSLTWAILQLKALGIDDILHFNFVSPPAAATMLHGLEILYSLECLDDQCKITPIGEILAEFPLEPRLAKVLYCSLTMGCSEEVCIIAAMLSVRDIWLHPRGSKTKRDKLDASVAEFAVREGDHITYLNVFREYEEEHSNSSRSRSSSSSYDSGNNWCSENMVSERSLKKATEVRKQLVNYLSSHIKQNKWKLDKQNIELKFDSCGEDTCVILKCFVKGFFSNVARLGTDGLYHTLKGSTTELTVQLHPSSTLAKFGSPSEFVLFNQFVSTDVAYVRDCSRIEGKWLIELAPHFYCVQDAKGTHVTNKQAYTSVTSEPFDENNIDAVVSRLESNHTSLLTTSKLLTLPSTGDSTNSSTDAGMRPLFTKPVFKKPTTFQGKKDKPSKVKDKRRR